MGCSSSSVGKRNQLLLKPTEVELGLQVGVEFDNSPGASVRYVFEMVREGAELFQNYPLIIPGFSMNNPWISPGLPEVFFYYP